MAINMSKCLSAPSKKHESQQKKDVEAKHILT